MDPASRGTRTQPLGLSQHLLRFAGPCRGLLVLPGRLAGRGREQEKTVLFRTEKRRNSEGRPYLWIVNPPGYVNRSSATPSTADFVPFYLNFCPYFPCNVKLCLLSLRHLCDTELCRVDLDDTRLVWESE